MHPRFNPRRAGRAGCQLAGTSTTYTGFQLWNNSLVGDYLAIWNWTVTPQANCGFTIGVSRTQLTSDGNPTSISALVAGDAPPAGSAVQTNTLVSALAFDYFAGYGANSVAIWPNPWPFAIIPPGWGFTMGAQTANVSAFVGCMYSALRPEELDPEAWINANLALSNMP